LAAVGAAFALPAVSVTPSSASADELAYSCAYDICTINPDNTSEHANLTETEGDEESPSWSPDGRWIAYSGDYTGLFELYVVDATKSAAESTAINISDNSEAQPEWEEPAVWSPDGSKVAYEEIYLSGNPLGHHVFVSPFDGTADQVPIGALDPADQGLHPSWTPDGKVVFSRGSLYSANPDGSGIAPFANAQGNDAVVSPDGRYVAVVQGAFPSSVVVYRTDGSGSVTMAKHGTSGGIFTDISWSPDSSQIAYSYTDASAEGIWVAPVDKSSEGHPIKAPAGWVDERNAAFSPDGSRIAFDALPASSGATQIFVAPAGGGEAVQITRGAVNNKQPFWKPCAGCGPPAKETGPSAPGGGGGGAGGGGSGGNAGGGGKTPVKVRLATLKRVVFVGHTLNVGVDCNAQGGHPDPKICNGDGIARAVAPVGALRPVTPWGGSLSRKPTSIVFAKGSVKVPGGKTKQLKMKLTAAGKKLAKPGATLTVRVVVTETADSEKVQTSRQTIKIKVPTDGGARNGARTPR